LRNDIPPYSLSVKDAGRYFGISPRTIYDMISEGKLHRGYHYIKMGKKVLIIREKFIEFLHQLDGSWQSVKEGNIYI